MSHVTVMVDYNEKGQVFEWLFANLSRPAELYTWRAYRGSKLYYRLMVWKKETESLNYAKKGTRYASDKDSGFIMTFCFRSREDATLFAIRWGSVPFALNTDMHNLVGGYLKP